MSNSKKPTPEAIQAAPVQVQMYLECKEPRVWGKIELATISFSLCRVFFLSFQNGPPLMAPNTQSVAHAGSVANPQA